MIDNFKAECNENLITTPPVPAEQAGARLDKWLSACTDLSRTRLSALIEDGCVSLSGGIIDSQTKKVREGEVFRILLPAPEPAVPQAQDIPLEIVYEDQDLIVIDKSADMVVHPAAGNWEGTLVNALLSHCEGSLSGIGGVIRPGIVHRLDKETSGLMVIAKNDDAHRFLSAQFAVHSLERCYLALVWGVPKPLSGVIENQIGRSRANRKKMAVIASGGKRAETHYRVMKILANGAVSLVECCLKTGRTHQVRVHMSSIGHSLVGDKAYGSAPKGTAKSELLSAANRFPRQALHSYKMVFEHPRTHKVMRFELPLPADMQDLASNLE